MLRYLIEKKWFFVANLLGALLLFLPVPDGLTLQAWKVLVMSIMATILFVTEPVPLPTMALLIIVGQVLLLGEESTVVAKSLMTDSVLFIMGSLMLAVALVKQKLDKRLALLIVRVTGTKTTRIAFGISLVSGILASFIGEHTVAAMMLPVAMALIQLTADEDNKARPAMAALLLFSISYACSIAGIGTPSGGARNAIMIDYLGAFFYDAADPSTAVYNVSYVEWIMYSYPLFLLQLPLMHLILRATFKSEELDLSYAVGKLREQVEQEGSLKPRHYVAIGMFAFILICWITLSTQLGMGTIALMGASLFLIAGLVRWQDLNTGVNWGVVLLYAAAISLGVQMKQTGAAAWVADSFLAVLGPLGFASGLGLLAAIMLLTTFITNTMSNGAAVAVLGPIVLNMARISDTDPLVTGFMTAVSSAFAYFTVIGTPASTIVYSSGLIKTSDFMKVGWKLALMSFAMVMVCAAVYWPLLSQ